MKMKKWAVLVAAGALVASLALFGCSSGGGQDSDAKSGDGNATDAGYTLVNDGKLTVAASLDFPPFENLNGNAPEGFEVDLMGLLAEEMGIESNYLPSTKFDTIVPLIQTGGKADVGVSGITITDERLEQVDFTDPVCDVNQSITVLKDSGITDVAQLEGKKIGGQSGTTGFQWAAENVKGAEVIAFDEMTAVFAALQSGQIDAIAVDWPVANYYVKNAYTDCQIIKEIPTGEQYAIAVSKENPELTKALNTALKAIKDNGKYDEAVAKWLS
ncbi:amino acid ABC transporter substrate-binding protein [Gordonibacter sp. 28C]|uniref:transporter substrate-binding domain-containing protein n=1 Tax=Gordonibacter sp. 28C TaxID=2078569 RepID=UPI000DF84750|nr:transporter substrate-binding domain-containing protein [Gordonibacter sp. 28C]RDB64540.1 amino acid ABC transporter substrate-binding protein [Gordonibacter sp. 28C]